MQKVKKSWKARGNRHATSRGAKEKPSVSQFEILKPVMQLAFDVLVKASDFCSKLTYPSG